MISAILMRCPMEVINKGKTILGGSQRVLEYDHFT